MFGMQENQDQISGIEAMNTDKKQVESIIEQIMGLKNVVTRETSKREEQAYCSEN